jgi:hypothetical protein
MDEAQIRSPPTALQKRVIQNHSPESPWEGARQSRSLPEETSETFRLRDDKREFFAERVPGDSGELP